MLPGGTLRGNLYFKRTLGRKSDAEDPSLLEIEVKPQEEQLADDEFERMKNQVTRYYNKDNPTLKCRNCK